MDIEGG